MKYALIGCGRISSNHIVAALANNLEIVGLCDLVEKNIDEKIEKYDLNKGMRKYLDYKDMLKKEKPELVAIATESGKHAEIALYCIEQGCNLIIEKPIALSIEDAKKIVELAKVKGVKVSACHQNRFNKSIAEIRKAKEQNRFGKLLYGTAHIRWNRGRSYYDQASWRGTWAQDGGALMNQCIHNIDLLRWMMDDEVAEVFAYTDNLAHDYFEAEDLGIALVKFKNGSYGIIEGTTDVYPKNLEETLYIFGEKGTVKAGGQSVNIIEDWRFGDGQDNAEEIMKNSAEAPPNVYGFGHSRLYEDVISAINENRAPYVDAIDGLKALELVLAIYKSAKEHKVVKLPLSNFSTMDMVGVFNAKNNYFVHESSFVDDDSIIGRNTKIWHFCHIKSNVAIGEDCNIGQNVFIDSNVTIGNGCKLQNNVSVYEGVELEDYVFCGPSMVFTNDLNPRAKYPKGSDHRIKTLVKTGATIGANATIVCGHTIGKNAFVAAGAVVTRDVLDYEAVKGVPARRFSWVCECGELLKNELVCAKCGRKYIQSGKGLKENTSGI